MSKVQKCIRIDQETADRLARARLEGESESAACNRVILAGLDALEGEPRQDESEGTQKAGGCSAEEDAKGGREGSQKAFREASEALVAAYREQVAMLQGELAFYRSQLAAKDSQINEALAVARDAQGNTGRAQALHAHDTMQLDTAGHDAGKRRPWWGRIFNRSDQ